MHRDVAVALGGPSHFAVHWEPSQEVPIIVHDLPFSGANAIRDCVSVLSILAKEMAVFCARIPKKASKTVF